MNPKIRALNTVPYVSVENMMNLVRDIGVERFLTKLSLYIALGSNFKRNGRVSKVVEIHWRRNLRV